MSLCQYLPRWLQRILRCRRIILTVRFGNPNCTDPFSPRNWRFSPMSTEVTLNASPSGTQFATATATVNVNGSASPSTPVNFTIEDTTVAIVESTTGQQCVVRAVADPAGNSTRTAQLTAAALGATAQGTITVVTQADVVTIAIDFGPPLGP